MLIKIHKDDKIVRVILTEDEINTIVESDKVIENIDKVIEHLIIVNHSWISWMR